VNIAPRLFDAIDRRPLSVSPSGPSTLAVMPVEPKFGL
jgi:hypothetical protein